VTYREQSGVEVGSTWLMFGVLLLSLVLVVVESFNERPAASIRFNGRECVVLQIWSIAILQADKEEM
jgi:hypothetical protein